MQKDPCRIHKIQIDSIDSTNRYLKSLALENELRDMTVVCTDHQTAGRGQIGAVWDSEKGKNIACSLYKQFRGISVSAQFYISMAVSLALFDLINELRLPNLKIKWPNDLYSGSKKIAGILIETTLGGGEISSAVIGIGVNVNQKHFEGLPNAASISKIIGKHIDLSYLKEMLFEKLQHYLDQLAPNHYAELHHKYEERLFRKGVVSLFGGAEIPTQNGIIQGVNQSGQLMVELEELGLKTFNLKEVKLLSLE